MMKRSILLAFLLIILALLPARVVVAKDPVPAPEFRLMLPLINRQVSLTVTHISPDFGRTLSVVQDPFHANILYTFTFGSGVYKSTDYGASWFASSKGMNYLTLLSLAADPVNPGVLYAGTYAEFGTGYNGVYKSTDYGETWAPTGEMGNTWNGVYYKNPVVYVVTVDTSNPNIVFAGTRMKVSDGSLGGGGVFRSNNGGQTWTPVNIGLPYNQLYVYDLILNPNNPGQVFATLHGVPPGGIYVSNNYGDSWAPFYVTGTKAVDDGRALALDPFNSNIMYYGTDTNGGLWRQFNGQWTHLLHEWNVNVRAISVDPNHPGLLFAGVRKPISGDDGSYYRLMRSADGGSHWLEIDAGNTSYPLAFSPNKQTMYMARDFSGVARSDDLGLTWYSSTAGITGYSVTGMAVAPNNSQYLAAAFWGDGVRVSLNGGASWPRRVSGLDTNYLTFLAMNPSDPRVMYVTTDQLGVYRSWDGGEHWSPVRNGYPTSAAGMAAASETPDSPYANRPIPEIDGDLLPKAETQPENSTQAVNGWAWGHTLAVSPFDPAAVLVGTSGRGVYRLEKDTWLPTGLTSGSAYSLVYDQARNGRVLAGVDSAVGSVLVSTNNGQTWTASNTGLTGRRVLALAQCGWNHNYFLAGTDSGVYASIDGGASWFQAGLGGQVVKGVTFYGANLAGKYFAATETAVYASETLPGPWAAVSNQMRNSGTQYMFTDPSGSWFYVISRLGGIKKVQ